MGDIMKITLFIDSLYRGGAERVVCELANYLVKNGHAVDILTIRKSEPSYIPPEGVNYIENIGVDEKIFSFGMLRKLEKLIALCHIFRNTKSDIYVVFLHRSIVLTGRLKRWLKVPVIFSERCDPASCGEITSDFVKAFPKANGLVFQTYVAKEYYEKRMTYLPESLIIPNAVADLFQPEDCKKEKYILSAGRFAEQKNFPLLIRAFSHISSDYPDINLVICGDGELRGDYEKLISELRLDNRVVLPGQVKDVKTWMNRAIMFVLSSDFEGIPNALMEAMACGLPCISTDCSGGGSRLLIKDGDNGCLVPVGDLDKLEQAIRKILDDQIFAARIASNAARIHDMYSPEIIYAEWEKFIVHIADKYTIRK